MRDRPAGRDVLGAPDAAAAAGAQFWPERQPSLCGVLHGE